MFDILRNLVAKRPHSLLILASILTCLVLTAPKVQAGTWVYGYTGDYPISGEFDYTDGVGFSDISIYNSVSSITDNGLGLVQDPTGTVFIDDDYEFVFGDPLENDPTPDTGIITGVDFTVEGQPIAGLWFNGGVETTAAPDPATIQTFLIGTIGLILVARRRWQTERKSQSDY